jgi:hypothetical protein
MKFLMRTAAIAATSLVFLATPAMAASVTGMSVIGGCPSGENGAYCFNAGNATETNVSILAGNTATEVAQGEVTGGDGSIADPWVFSNPSEFTITLNEDGLGGTWSIFDASITHLAFKADGYFILGEVSAGSGIWSTVITDWSPDITTLSCPAGICAAGPRAYTELDFTNSNGNGNPAQLSNVRAYNVVPIPAAVWLFVSGLVMLGCMRRKRFVAK